jgi:hypothetical protein
MRTRVSELRRELELAEVRAMALRAVSQYRRLPKGLRSLAAQQARGFERIATLAREAIAARDS